MQGRRLVLASGNRGKLAEMQRLLAPLDLVVVAQSALQVPEAVEDGLTFVENALLKARNASAHTGLPALADDSGLCVDALAGAPGIHSARFAGPDADDRRNIEHLLEALRDVPAGRRSARFHCCIVLLTRPFDPLPLICTGSWEGQIATAPSGSAGFGYDPVFEPVVESSGAGRSAAEFSAEEKNEASHRGAALRSLVALLSSKG